MVFGNQDAVLSALLLYKRAENAIMIHSSRASVSGTWSTLVGFSMSNRRGNLRWQYSYWMHTWIPCEEIKLITNRYWLRWSRWRCGPLVANPLFLMSLVSKLRAVSRQFKVLVKTKRLVSVAGSARPCIVCTECGDWNPKWDPLFVIIHQQILP